MQISGMITGTLGYSLKREFLANAIALRDVETFSYEIYSIDFSGFSANTIQNQIKNQFSQVYSGDINVTVFDTQNTYAFPSDSLRAAKYGVTVEIRKPVANLATMMPELASGYYAGLDAAFITGYGAYLLDFKESFNLATNSNGNREFSHDLSFGLKTGFSNGSTQSGRKAFAQTIASGIFAQDKNTNLGYATMLGQISTLADNNVTKNYFTESYDLMKNAYGFSRKREFLPADTSGVSFNLNHSFSLGSDGITELTEKGTFQGKLNFNNAKNTMEAYAGYPNLGILGSYYRCVDLFNKFYNTGVIFQDPQFNGQAVFFTLQWPPIKIVKINDAKNMVSSYEVTYTNNPTLQNYGGVPFYNPQVTEFSVDAYDKVEGTLTCDLTVDRVGINDAAIADIIQNNEDKNAKSIMVNYYFGYFPNIAAKFPAFNMIKKSATIPKFKSKASSKYFWSNNPSYMIGLNGAYFPIFDYTVTDKKPVDIVNEYKTINRPTKTSVMSYGYQTQKGEVSVNIRASIGRQCKAFFPDGVGTFTNSSIIDGQDFSVFWISIYKTAGQIFMERFTTPATALNWFISDSKFSLDNEGNLNAEITFTYTIKKRLIGDNP